MKNTIYYLTFIGLIIVVVVNLILFIEQWYFSVFAFILSGIMLALLNVDDSIVISKDKIVRKYRKKPISHYYVMFIEIAHLPVYSQFFDIKLADQIALIIYRKLKKDHTDVYMYGVNQLVVIGEFPASSVVSQRLRYNIKEMIGSKYHALINKQSIVVNESKYKPEAYIGISSTGARDDSTSIGDLISLAHFTMIKGKERQEFVTITDEVLRITSNDIKLFYQELEKGLTLDEFVPYFLPVFQEDHLKIIGMESLLRWEKNKYRVIEAGKFVHIAEEKGILADIDLKIFHQALRAYKEWRDSDLIDAHFTITINFSKQALLKTNVVDILRSIDQSGISRHLIEFDISEETIRNQECLEKVHRLFKEGIRFSLDAFQSSETILKSLLSVDLKTIKIDRNMLPKSKDQVTEQAYYYKLIEISRIFNLQVMAKGIENKIQLDIAKASQVEYFQGYYFTPPLNMENATKYLKKYRNGILE
jgi:EAL domain-containing protein (putative c-di-GMP-specific phosphodiesterase class I)